MGKVERDKNMNTDTTINANPASEKQISFLSDLLASRECDAEMYDELISAIHEDMLDKRQASAAIDKLVNAPRKKKEGAKSPFQELLSTIPKSKYAVPTDELIASEFEDMFSGDIVFLELKEFMGTLYMRSLHGAPGRFTRARIAADATKYFVKLIATDPYKYTKLFGDHYACCGSCGAELTDARSRELMLGPECRKKFGF
jgi:hypothetical protein